MRSEIRGGYKMALNTASVKFEIQLNLFVIPFCGTYKRRSSFASVRSSFASVGMEPVGDAASRVQDVASVLLNPTVYFYTKNAQQLVPDE